MFAFTFLFHLMRGNACIDGILADAVEWGVEECTVETSDSSLRMRVCVENMDWTRAVIREYILN